MLSPAPTASPAALLVVAAKLSCLGLSLTDTQPLIYARTAKSHT